MARGGKRENAGRKHGTVNHFTSKNLIEAFKQRGYNPVEEVVNIYQHYENNMMIENQENFMKNFSKYIFKEVPKTDELDVTSNGETMSGMFIIKRDK